MRKIRILFFTSIIFSISLFSRDTYIFDENRIRQVFSEYELIDYESSPQVWLSLLNRESDLSIQISNYSKNDSVDRAKSRFRENAAKDEFVTYRNPKNSARSILGMESTSYTKDVEGSKLTREHLFFDEVKISINHDSTETEYEDALKLIKEAIDPNMPLRNRQQRVFNKNYSIDNYIDKNKLVANARNRFNNVTFYEREGNVTDPSEYQIVFDLNKLATRGILIRANNNYNNKVILRRWENHINNSSYPYKFRDEEKRITQKYFGVNARTYTNDYVRRESKLPILGVMRVAITEDFTIITMTYEASKNKRQELVEYEEFLKIVAASMK
jgi:hypothetical protein